MTTETRGGSANDECRRIMGLDLGDRRIGVALSDPLLLTAQALRTLVRTSLGADLDALAALAREHGIARIVVGLPLQMDGTRSKRVPLTEAFMERLRRKIGVPVVSWDERMTTVQAERSLLEADVSRARRRQVIDQVAAVILLQAYLDARRGGAVS